VTKTDIFPAWGRILTGYQPLLSVEITKECPLRCPGCYAYGDNHLGGPATLRQLSDFKDARLIEAMLALVRRYRPLHLSIVGGEPLVRYRELDALLPMLDRMGIEVQIVTSAVRAIPQNWASIRRLHMVVSIDGLQPEHDARRAPATYDRILKHISGHQIVVHCTITRQQLSRPDYLRDFAAFWAARSEVRKIWFSLFTPQQGDESEERLTPRDREAVIARLSTLASEFKKVDMPRAVLEGYRNPPQSPSECIFAQTTTTVSADLQTKITPCQFGGRPVCSECGCMASAGLASIGRHKLGGLVRVETIFDLSHRIGRQVAAAAARNGVAHP
jgi:MoaA/NifB/PqqE/SkfB family radical SAM enzyme